MSLSKICAYLLVVLSLSSGSKNDATVQKVEPNQKSVETNGTTTVVLHGGASILLKENMTTEMEKHLCITKPVFPEQTLI